MKGGRKLQPQLRGRIPSLLPSPAVYGYGGPVRAFWSSPWNVFDFFIVVVGVTLMLGVIPPDSPAGKLKLLRAFRVFRLFKRIKVL